MRGPLKAIMMAVAISTAIVSAGDVGSAQDKPIPKLTPEMLSDADSIRSGAQIWEDQCRHCHGADAYPGKAPKLRPGKYSPEFVYHRVAYGFRGMPPWEEAYTDEELIGIVAYVLSPQFSP